ncbi:MAG: thiamine-phosphate kinase [Chloracidobacterium sp.]|nr:thiamine-phosphate kinase [Chloracidobacterium sp.]
MRTEFEMIESLKHSFNLKRIGDDCAVLPKDAYTDLVVTADMLVEDVDFRLHWATAEQIGHKSLAVSLSDVAAMGGRPMWALVSIAVPDRLWNSGFVDRFFAGWHSIAAEFDVELVGGDISGSPNSLVIDSVVGGEVKKGKAILRSGAKVGDSIYVSGSLGGAAGGLYILESTGNVASLDTEMVLRQLQPSPHVLLANSLVSLYVLSSMVDISDGLSSDLGHICRSSNVGARIYAERIPIDSDLADILDPKSALQKALNGGEDFELLFTSSNPNISLNEQFRITKIGEITERNESVKIVIDGKSCELSSDGFQHF